MIDNLVLLITGTLHKRKLTELLKRCHPLGWFEGMPALGVPTNAEELYHTVLVETPLGMCFHADIRLQKVSAVEMYSGVLPGLLKGGRLGCVEHRNYSELALQSVPGGLSAVLPITWWPDGRRNGTHPCL